MQVNLFRDYAALSFVRCTTPLPGGGNAGAAAWTLSGAVRKCESEYAERVFQRTQIHPRGISPIGIAAHVEAVAAVRHAADEVAETLCLEVIHRSGEFRCLRLRNSPSFKFGITRTSQGFFALLIAELNGVPFGVYSAAPGFASTLLKTWEEFRNVKFFQPDADELATFTKANKLFAIEELRGLPFVPDRQAKLSIDVSNLELHETEFEGRNIAYYLRPQPSKKE